MDLDLQEIPKPVPIPKKARRIKKIGCDEFFCLIKRYFINFNMLIMFPISEQQHMHTS
jgi:hypothetical protein